MLRRVRETAPGLLVPAAWTLAGLAHAGFAADRTVAVAHGVMSVLLVAFVVSSWRDMREGALRVWRTVILLGVPVTLAGTVSFLDPPASPAALQTIAVVGWMALPAWGLIETGRRMAAEHPSLPAGGRPRVYTLGGAASGLGAIVYLVGSVAGESVPGGSITAWLVGIALVAVGQTAGILLAVARSRRPGAGLGTG